MYNVRNIQGFKNIQVADGYSPFFAKAYFCVIVIIGHYYLLQLLLAVLNMNLTNIVSEEAFDEIRKNKMRV